MCYVDSLDIHTSTLYKARMSPVLNGSSAIRHFKHSNAIEIRDRITFDFYTGLYNYHHSTKLYWKISRVCCRLYCYECAARVTMPTATNE